MPFVAVKGGQEPRFVFERTCPDAWHCWHDDNSSSQLINVAISSSHATVATHWLRLQKALHTGNRKWLITVTTKQITLSKPGLSTKPHTGQHTKHLQWSKYREADVTSVLTEVQCVEAV